MLTQELTHDRFRKRESKEGLRQLFPTLPDEKVDGVKSLTESYHKYKKKYVKHLSFNPEEENLSKGSHKTLQESQNCPS